MGWFRRWRGVTAVDAAYATNCYHPHAPGHDAFVPHQPRISVTVKGAAKQITA
ncbi:hypothetical protein FD19_GL000995 [Lacticaseibacillus thailandensis DSM 22698 = JCM 13996]|uniref:Uncharacterized protein n=1 Tax=Lacticaseibacillus thailandensis DSM 22698 = JCM 13996 TaxID=1423810 RepID=A0A0R2C6U4_9LACO|nr:hypothetical protein FD19_GL000995 [Lacticaseibacillus thailandensis DSM 22698 = JCM 13996]